jgi:DNA-binding SARP family transcriptional activator/tetratricopeptide (TPR) repeat protein
VGGALGLHVQLLGPVEAQRDGLELAIGGPLQRAVMAVLALAGGQVVGRSALVDALWGHSAPASAEGSIYSYVSALRKVLDSDASDRSVLVTSRSGYLLHLAEDALDVRVAEGVWRRAQHARLAGDGVAVATELDVGLRMWRGVPLGELEMPFVMAERFRLQELRLAMVQLRAEVLLELGRAGEAVTMLRDAIIAEPLREALSTLLMIGLYRAGRQAEALAVFADVRRQLAAELGVEPGVDLQLLQQRILRSDPGLMLATERAAPSQPASTQPAYQGGPPAQLPRPVADFVGRVDELAQLVKLSSADLSGRRPVVLLTGAGGVGKTALAVQAAHSLRDSFPDGQVYVNLRGFGPEPPLPISAALMQLLRAVGVDPARVSSDEATQAGLYRSLLADKQMLIVLDNARDSRQVENLLPGASRCLVIVTSRHDLGGLAVRFGAQRLAVNALSSQDAVSLLSAMVGVERVLAEPEAAAELVALCSYLPLAIRVTAERVERRAELKLVELVGALAGEKSRLDAFEVDDDPLASVRAVLSWSYQTLDHAQAAAFRRLGLHPGPEFSATAAAVLTGLGLPEAVRLLDALAARHLLERVGGDRYRFHDLIHEYASELIAADEDAAGRSAVTRRMLVWYLHSAAALRDALFPGELALTTEPVDPPCRALEFAGSAEALAWGELELSNLVGATRLAADTGNDDLAWHLPRVLQGFFYTTKHWDAWLTANRIGLASAESLDDALGQAITLNNLALGYVDTQRPDIAIDYLQRSVQARARSDDRRDECLTLTMLSNAVGALGNFQQARDYAEQAVASARQTANRRGEVYALAAVAVAHGLLGQFEELEAFSDMALEAGREFEDFRYEAHLYSATAGTFLRANLLPQARSRYERSLEAALKVGDISWEARAHAGLAELDHRSGDDEAARRRARQALQLFHELNAEEAASVQALLDSLESSA